MTSMTKTWCCTLPIRTVSEANLGSEHWTKRHKRHKAQKQRVKWQWKIDKPKVSLPCKVILTRIAPRALDRQENLPVSMKYIVDAIADCLIPGLPPGKADSDKRIEWEYAQEKGMSKQYALKIEIFQHKD